MMMMKFFGAAKAMLKLKENNMKKRDLICGIFMIGAEYLNKGEGFMRFKRAHILCNETIPSINETL